MRRKLLPASLAVLAAATVTTVILNAPVAQAAEPVVVVNSTFEDGTAQNWTSRADEVVANSTAVAHAN